MKSFFLPTALLFFGLAFSSQLSAQMSNEELDKQTTEATIDTSAPEQAVLRAAFIDERLERDHLYLKNPNAAGRSLLRAERYPVVLPLPSRDQLFGPAYKNRQLDRPQVDSVGQPESTKPRLMGPRYKNRSAKSRN